MNDSHQTTNEEDGAHRLAQQLQILTSIMSERSEAETTTSYTASLLYGKDDSLLKKIVEEAAETALAAKNNSREQLAEELADLWFHCLIVMTRYNVPLADVAAVLEKRQGVSGLVEKASRHQQ